MPRERVEVLASVTKATRNVMNCVVVIKKKNAKMRHVPVILLLLNV